jgi:hypothetical protein
MDARFVGRGHNPGLYPYLAHAHDHDHGGVHGNHHPKLLFRDV